MPGLTYDTGAPIAAERNNRRTWALHAALLAEEAVPTVPTPTIADAFLCAVLVVRSRVLRSGGRRSWSHLSPPWGGRLFGSRNSSDCEVHIRTFGLLVAATVAAQGFGRAGLEFASIGGTTINEIHAGRVRRDVRVPDAGPAAADHLQRVFSAERPNLRQFQTETVKQLPGPRCPL